MIICFTLLFSSCSNKRVPNEWEIVYKVNRSGEMIIGKKENLINAIRHGADIKIGWGGKGEKYSIEHLSVPIWLAILDEKEVIAHLDPQILSTIQWDSLSANYADPQKLNEEWRVVITSKGEFDAVWYDRKGDSLIKRIPQNHVITWFSKNIENIANPLY